jgi:hypothetical protein
LTRWPSPIRDGRQNVREFVEKGFAHSIEENCPPTYSGGQKGIQGMGAGLAGDGDRGQHETGTYFGLSWLNIDMLVTLE